MKTYSAIKAEIAKLEKEAEAVRKSELKAVISEVKRAVETHGLTAKDLGLDRVKPKSVGRQAAPSTVKAVAGARVGTPMYRDPKTQSTWTGRGRPPTWITASKDRNVFLINRPASAEAATIPDATSAPKTKPVSTEVASKAPRSSPGKKAKTKAPSAKKPSVTKSAKKTPSKGTAKKTTAKAEAGKSAA